MGKLARDVGVPEYLEKEFSPGHNACPGCGSTTALRMVLNTIGENSVYFVPASCASLYFGPQDTSATRVPVIHTLFPGCFAEAEGMAHALRLRGSDRKVVVWAGDGCCYDIALGALSGIASRGADVLVVCNDNEGYQNTGGHESTATHPDAATRTGRRSEHGIGIRVRKDLIEIMAAHRVPYLATASPAFPHDLRAKVERAAATRGFRLILLSTPCVTWGIESCHAVKVARLAVETGFFPLYEVVDGRRYRVTHEPAMVPLSSFTRLQKRFDGVDLELMRRELEERWEDLRLRCARAPSAPAVEEVPASRPQWVTR